MKVKTEILTKHKSLIEIFMEACNLDVKVNDYTKNVGNVKYTLIELEYEDDSDTAFTISVMSLKNCGLRNMLEDYLIKCGISPFYLNAPDDDERLSDGRLNEHLQSISHRIDI